MHPRVHDAYQYFARKYEMRGPFLEVGVGSKEDAILSGAYFAEKPERYASNILAKEIGDETDPAQIKFIRCNANDMREKFADGQFGTVLCNAMIEHDKYFWRSLDEMKRVLAPGGILAIGAPGYIERQHLDTDIITESLPKATVTLDLHSRPDYWRFSRLAFRDLICEGLEVLEVVVMLRTPVILAMARKPEGGLLAPVPQAAWSKEQQERDKFVRYPYRSANGKHAAEAKEARLLRQQANQEARRNARLARQENNET